MTEPAWDHAEGHAKLEQVDRWAVRQAVKLITSESSPCLKRILPRSGRMFLLVPVDERRLSSMQTQASSFLVRQAFTAPSRPFPS